MTVGVLFGADSRPTQSGFSGVQGGEGRNRRKGRAGMKRINSTSQKRVVGLFALDFVLCSLVVDRWVNQDLFFFFE